MAYDEGTAQRIREIVADRPGVSEKKMFGGLCILDRGNMACGITSEDLMVRVGADAYANCLALPHAREMDFTGRSLKGMVYVAADGLTEDEDLQAWIERGLAFTSTLPAK